MLLLQVRAKIVASPWVVRRQDLSRIICRHIIKVMSFECTYKIKICISLCNSVIKNMLLVYDYKYIDILINTDVHEIPVHRSGPVQGCGGSVDWDQGQNGSWSATLEITLQGRGLAQQWGCDGYDTVWYHNQLLQTYCR